MKGYLRKLPLEAQVLEQLSAVDADSLFELASVATASPSAFAQLLRSETEAELVRRMLLSHLGGAERAALDAPPPDFHFGAIIDSAAPRVRD